MLASIYSEYLSDGANFVAIAAGLYAFVSFSIRTWKKMSLYLSEKSES